MREVSSFKQSALFAVLAVTANLSPCAAQTVIRDSTPPARADSTRATPTSTRTPADSGKATRPDSAPKPAGAIPAAPVPAAPAPAAAAVNPYPKGVCADGEVGASAEVLLVTFRARSQPAARQAALKPVGGTLVAPDPSDDASWYVRFPSDGNEFALRAMADRLIRAPIVKEVGPVQCSAR